MVFYDLFCHRAGHWSKVRGLLLRNSVPGATVIYREMISLPERTQGDCMGDALLHLK